MSTGVADGSENGLRHELSRCPLWLMDDGIKPFPVLQARSQWSLASLSTVFNKFPLPARAAQKFCDAGQQVYVCGD